MKYNRYLALKVFNKYIFLFVLLLLLFISLMPVIWTFLTSIKSNVDAWSMPPKVLFKPSMKNYNSVIYQKGFGKFILHSVIVGVSSIIFSLFLGVPLAYAFARSKFPLKNTLFIFVFLAYILPPIILAIPLYVIGARLKLLDKYIIIIITHTTFCLAFTVWMMRGFFEEVPREVEENALIDGCNYFGAFFNITLPIVKSGLAATVIFCFILSWNDFMYALVLTGVKTRTVPVAIAMFLTPHGMFWGEMSAANCLAIIPVFLFAVFFQRHLVRGMTLGAIK